MKYLMNGVIVAGFLGAGVYLILNTHPTAGGWLLFAAILAGFWSVEASTK